MPGDIEAFVAVAIVALVIFVLVRLAAMSESHEITEEEYESNKRGSPLGNAMLNVQSILEPEKTHMLEERRADRAEQAETGAPPDPSATD